MSSVVAQDGVEACGRNPATLLRTDDQARLFDPPELTPGEFLRRLVFKEFKKDVALTHYPPIDKRTGRELTGPALEKAAAQAVDNLDRLLDGTREPTLRLLDSIRKVIPGAGVAIAHYFADRCGTERGSPKLDGIRITDEIIAVRELMQKRTEAEAHALRRLAVLEEYVKHQKWPGVAK